MLAAPMYVSAVLVGPDWEAEAETEAKPGTETEAVIMVVAVGVISSETRELKFWEMDTLV